MRDPDPKNAYINTIEHIDAEVGLPRSRRSMIWKLTDNTYVIYTADNGPWLPFRHHGGSAGPLRDGKGTTFEGGQRRSARRDASAPASPPVRCAVNSGPAPLICS